MEGGQMTFDKNIRDMLFVVCFFASSRSSRFELDSIGFVSTSIIEIGLRGSLFWNYFLIHITSHMDTRYSRNKFRLVEWPRPITDTQTLWYSLIIKHDISETKNLEGNCITHLWHNEHDEIISHQSSHILTTSNLKLFKKKPTIHTMSSIKCYSINTRTL